MQNSPYDQQPYGQPSGQTPGTSSTGLQENLAALLTYIFIPITSIIFLVIEKSSRLVRFHAMQALLLGVGMFVLMIVLSIVMTVVIGVAAAASSTLAGIVGLISMLFWLVLLIGMLLVWVLCLVKAYQGQMFKLPIIGNIAEGLVSK
ncbi:MAG: DUF4870 domain-containing protein [Acidobacteriota bacterium]|nr:DUF4870 domain-containing protein [Acidobacteriota bacterium]